MSRPELRPAGQRLRVVAPIGRDVLVGEQLSAVETIRVSRTKCHQRVQKVANRQKLCHVLVDLLNDI
jgi:hypothetical protein